MSDRRKDSSCVAPLGHQLVLTRPNFHGREAIAFLEGSYECESVNLPNVCGSCNGIEIVHHRPSYLNKEPSLHGFLEKLI